MNRMFRRATFTSVLLVASTSGVAQDAQTLRARSLAATCSQCHGTDGRAIANSAIPGLAGMPAPYFTEQMKGFKSGARAGTVMPQIAKGFSDEQLAQIAGWYSSAPAGAPK